MGTDVIDTSSIEETVRALLPGGGRTLHHTLINYDEVKHPRDQMPPCPDCQPGEKAEPHSHYHLWVIITDKVGDQLSEHELDIVEERYRGLGRDSVVADDRPGRRIALYLICQYADGAAFKGFMESDAPFFFTCPVRYLGVVPRRQGEVIFSDGWTWRMCVREYSKLSQRRKNRRSKARRGGQR